MNSDLSLKRRYNQFNKKYFGGELPGNTSVWWEPCVGAAGQTGEIDGAEELGIKIDPFVTGCTRWRDLTLIHEMAHIKLWPLGYKIRDHGRKFDEEIQRLCTFRSYRKLL